MSVQPHPVLACLDRVEQALKDVAGVDPAFMRPEEKAEALRRLVSSESQVVALRMRVMVGANELAEATADRSVATWLAAESRTDARSQEVKEQRAENRCAEGTADGAEKGHPRGGHSEVFEARRVLHDEDQHLHTQPDTGTQDE